MTVHDGLSASDDLFARLRQLWRWHDPMPADLVDKVIVALATNTLSVEYAMLTRLESTGVHAAVRGVSDVQLLEFRHGSRSIMVRVSDLGDGRRRIDGWIAPASPLLVRLEQDDDDFTTAASAEGRFDFADIPAGRTRMWFQPDASNDGVGMSRQGFTTEHFPL